MTVKINQVLNGADFTDAQRRALSTLFGAVVDDVSGVITSHVGLAAKLDDDATVTDTNYEALWTPSATLTD